MPVTIDEYLTTEYEPDCDFVDGSLEERIAGDWDHSRTMTAAGSFLSLSYPDAMVLCVLRLRVSPTRIRVADLCVYLENPKESVPSKPPFLCIEIVSPEDRMSRLQVKIHDYLAMGVPWVWVLDPETRQAYVATAADGLREVKSGVLRTESPVMELPLAEVFEQEEYEKIVSEKIERALEQFDRGECYTAEESRAEMQCRKADWLARNRG